MSSSCSFASLGIDLLGAAQEYLLPKLMIQIEDVLVDKITPETVLDMYHASFSAGASRLNVRCAMSFLLNYDKVKEDEPEERSQTLLHILDNVDPRSVTSLTT